MTCFWDAIISSLTKEDFTILGQSNKPSIKDFIKLLLLKNVKVDNVKWNDKILTQKEIEEHFEAIKSYTIDNITSGHLTSICDSFLLLICQLLRLNIVHYFLKHKILYSNIQKTRKTLVFGSNKSHFYRK